ncbi:MAG: hypothetical protein ACREGR_04200 [Minisyncoccia bacterium]
MNPLYFRGVAVGLTIAWVTSAIAYYVVHYVRGGPSSGLVLKLTIFELVVSVIMFAVAYLV